MQTLASTSCMTASGYATASIASSSGPASPLMGGRGSFQVLTHMMRNEGSLSPFKGMSFPLLSTALQSALIFQVYGVTLRFLEGSKGPPITAHNHTHYSEDFKGGTASSCSHHGETNSSSSSRHPSFVHTFIAGSTAGFVQVFQYVFSSLPPFSIKCGYQ